MQTQVNEDENLGPVVEDRETVGLSIRPYNNDHGDRSVELLVNGTPLVRDVWQEIPPYADHHGFIVHDISDDGLPTFPPRVREAATLSTVTDFDPTVRIVGECGCGEYGCGHIRCQVENIGDKVLFHNFHDEHYQCKPVSFLFERGNYEQVCRELIQLRGDWWSSLKTR